MISQAYVVESPALDGVTGDRIGTFRLYVATEERASFISGQHPERSFRMIPIDQVPARAREELEKAHNGNHHP